VSLDDIIQGVVTDVTEVRRRRRLPHVAITIDVGASSPFVAEADRMNALLLPLVAAACEAATAPTPASDGPPLHEVVITAVETSHGIEIEVADSGPGRTMVPDEGIATARSLAERLGGGLVVAACPDGGTAVTLCLPSCREQGPAIRAAA
jgi:signal transduction histidine kinase